MAQSDDAKERAKQKFLADRAALLQKAKKRLDSVDDSDEEEEIQWSTNKGVVLIHFFVFFFINLTFLFHFNINCIPFVQCVAPDKKDVGQSRPPLNPNKAAPSRFLFLNIINHIIYIYIYISTKQY